MTTATEQPIVYAGDDRPESFSRNLSQIVQDALTATIPVLPKLGDPKAAEQAQKALEALVANFPAEDRHEDGFRVETYRLDAAVTQQSLAALMVAEHVLQANDISDEVYDGVVRALRATGRRLIDKGDGHRGWVPLDIFVVVFDETKYWAIPDEWKDKLAGIEGVYFFDRSQITHCCSPSGSYWLEHLENREVLKPEFDQNHRLRDEINEWIICGRTDDSSNYYDESSIESLLKENPRGRVYHYGNPGFDLDKVRESAQSDAYSKIRYTREQTNYKLKQQNKALLPVDDQTIAKMVTEEFSDESRANEAVHQAIMEAVREHLQANSVI